MSALAVAVPVVQGSPEWLEARLDLIGASEAAASMGLSQWESKVGLWARKLRLLGPVEQTPRMRFGLMLEPIIATLAEEALDLAPGSLRRVNQLRRSVEYPFMGASLDRVRPGRRIVELKWSERAEGYGEPGTDEVPDEVLVQVLHQLIVTGYESADIALLSGPPPVRLYHVDRDTEAEAAIVEREREFWHHVETRTEPPIDGSEATRAYLATRYPRDFGTEMVATPELAGELGRALAGREAVKAAEEDQRTADNILKAAMGTASRLDAPGVGYVLWRTSKDGTKTSWELVARAYRKMLDLAVAHAEKGEPFEYDSVRAHADTIESLYTETKEGSRPFLPKPAKEQA